MFIKKAQRQKAKLRIGVFGASGSGKTTSALYIAYVVGSNPTLPIFTFFHKPFNVERVYIRRFIVTGVYRLTIMVPEELDKKIDSKVIPLLTNKHRVIIHAISKGIDYLTPNNLIEHKSDWYYFQRKLSYNILEVGLADNPEQQALKTRIKELSIKFNQPARVIGYNALIRGIEHG